MTQNDFVISYVNDSGDRIYLKNIFTDKIENTIDMIPKIVEILHRDQKTGIIVQPFSEELVSIVMNS